MRKLFSSALLVLSLGISSQTWAVGDVSMKDKLPYLSYLVTQLSFTEPAYDNAYWENYDDGIYVDIIDGTPLFSSRDKYNSHTGWATFSRSIKPLILSYRPDMSDPGEKRTEIRSKSSQAHLGHLFIDGPVEYKKRRYCMNSAALRFIPKDQLEASGYGQYLVLFP